MGIEGKVALVTGAGQGIGRAIALRLAQDGADIALVDLHQEKLEAVAEEVQTLGRKAVTSIHDIGDRTEVFAAVEVAVKHLGGLDIMVNNAGISQVKALMDVDEDEAVNIDRINVQGTLWGIQAAATTFRKHNTRGKIINACSIAGHESYPLLGMYSSSKFAIRALTQCAAKELAPDGITVNAYCPGVVGTDMWENIDSKMAEITGAEKGATYDKFVNGILLGRAEKPEDVAAFVSYLAGPDSDYMTGQAPLIDGGLVFR